jgi:hypothetical protein
VDLNSNFSCHILRDPGYLSTRKKEQKVTKFSVYIIGDSTVFVDNEYLIFAKNVPFDVYKIRTCVL